MGQMRSAVEREQLHRPVGPVIGDRADASRVDHVDVQRVLHRGGQVRQRKLFEQPQHLNERPGAVPRVVGFQPPAEQVPALVQIPVFQRLGVVKAAGLALQQRQIMDRIEEGPFAVPTARMLGDQSILEHQPHLGDRRDHRDLAMRVRHRDRVVVVVEPHQRLRIGRSLFDATRFESLLRRRQERLTILAQKLLLRGRLPACARFSIGHVASPHLLVQRFEGPDLGQRKQKVAAGKPDQPFDMPLLVRRPHQTEMLLEQVVTLQPQELLRQLPLAALQDFDHRDGRVVVADSPRHAVEELKRQPMPLQEGLAAFARKHSHEDRPRVRQRHHE